MILNTPIEELQKNLTILAMVVNERMEQEKNGKIFTPAENKKFAQLKKEHDQYKEAVELLKKDGIN